MSQYHPRQYQVHHGHIDSFGPMDIDAALEQVKIMLLSGLHNIVITNPDVEVTGESNYRDPPEGDMGALVLRIPLKRAQPNEH